MLGRSVWTAETAETGSVLWCFVDFLWAAISPWHFGWARPLWATYWSPGQVGTARAGTLSPVQLIVLECGWLKCMWRINWGCGEEYDAYVAHKHSVWQDDWDRTLQTIGTHISIPQFSAFLVMPCPVASAALSMVCMMCSLSCGTDACASWILSLDKPSKSSRRPRPEANRAERKASFSLAEQDKWYNMKQAGFQWLRFTW